MKIKLSIFMELYETYKTTNTISLKTESVVYYIDI